MRYLKDYVKLFLALFFYYHPASSSSLEKLALVSFISHYPRIFWVLKFFCCCCCFLFFGFFLFLGWHMEVPRLGVKSKLQLPDYAESDPRVTYTVAHGNIVSLTHWARPGMEPASSWIIVGFGFVTPELHWELPSNCFDHLFTSSIYLAKRKRCSVVSHVDIQNLYF